MFTVQTLLGAQPVLGTQTRYEAPGDPQVDNVESSDYYRVIKAVLSIMARSWLWGSLIKS